MCIRDSVCTTSLSFFAVFIIKALLPYAVVLSVGLGLCVILRCRKQQQDDRSKNDITTVQRLVSSAVYVVYYLYPSMVTHLLRIFHCTDPIHGAGHYGETYLYTDLAIECGSGKHTGARTIAFIFLLVYIIAVPVLVYWITVRNKARLDDADFRAMYGFIFLGYEKDSAWWEILVLARKLALVAVLVFAGRDTFLQSFFALFVLLVATAAQQYRQPFTKKELNRMELFGLYALVLTQLISMAYFWVDSHGLKKSPSEQESITLWTTVLLLAINVDALLVFAGHIGVASVDAVKSW